MKLKMPKRKLVTGAATAAVLMSLVAGMLFNGVTEITPELTQTSVNQPPIVMDIDEFANANVDDDDDDATEDKKSSGGIVNRLKQAVLNAPFAVRLIVVLPLWLIGTALMTIVSLMGRVLLGSPIGAFLAAALVGFGVLVGLYAVTAKTLFPDVPMRKILSKGALVTLGVVAIGLAGLDAIAPLFWQKYPFYAGAVKLGTGALVIGILSARVKSIRDRLENKLQLAG